MGVTIYYCLCALFKTEALNLIFYFSLGVFGGGFFLKNFFFLIIWMTKGHYNLAFYCICFWSLLSSIGKTTVCVFLAVVCIILFIHPFCPFIEKIKKNLKVHSVSFWCPHLTHAVGGFQQQAIGEGPVKGHFGVCAPHPKECPPPSLPLNKPPLPWKRIFGLTS